MEYQTPRKNYENYDDYAFQELQASQALNLALPKERGGSLPQRRGVELRPGCFHKPNLVKGIEFKKCNMARGCLCCLKYTMFLFNLIFWLCGCGLLGVGIWLSVSQGSFATFSPSFPSLSAANLVIAIGAIVMVTGFLGCLGAIKENKCLLLSFFIVLLIILLAELILLILFFVYSDKVSENAKQDLKDGLSLYNTDNNVGLRNAWNIIQAEWKCCGVVGYTDWHEALKEKVVPDRCCQEHYQECGRNSTNMFWTRGCYEKVEEWLDDNKHLMGTIGMCILVVQVSSKLSPGSVCVCVCV
uniref:Tetraspanin-9 n=1 Tax=Oncorhynchus kisutch TaxID=8019 RepID=A0A8C7J7G3_ONCKI